MSVDKLLLAKQEVTYGVDPTPDDTNAIETMDLQMDRYAGDKTERNVDRNTIGGKESIAISPHTNASFGVGLASSGTAGTAPAHGPLWRACGFDETIVAVTSAAYQLPATKADLDAADSVTMWDSRSQSGLTQKMTGCRGKNSISMGRGELPKIEFSDFLGSYNTPIALAGPTGIDWSGWKAELPFTKGNVPVLTLDGESACTESFNIDFGQDVQRRNVPGCEQTIITGYTITGQMVIVAPSISLKNWFTVMESHSQINKVAFAMTFGNTAGAIIEIAASEVQLINIAEGESGEGDEAYTFDLSFIDSPIVTFK